MQQAERKATVLLAQLNQQFQSRSCTISTCLPTSVLYDMIPANFVLISTDPLNRATDKLYASHCNVQTSTLELGRLASLFLSVTTAKSLMATYLSFKENKYITLSHWQGPFPPVNLRLRLLLLGCLPSITSERTTRKGLVGTPRCELFSLTCTSREWWCSVVLRINLWSWAPSSRTKASSLGSYLELAQAPCKEPYFSYCVWIWKKHLFHYKDPETPASKMNILLTLRQADAGALRANSSTLFTTKLPRNPSWCSSQKQFICFPTAHQKIPTLQSSG